MYNMQMSVEDINITAKDYLLFKKELEVPF